MLVRSLANSVGAERFYGNSRFNARERIQRFVRVLQKNEVLANRYEIQGHLGAGGMGIVYRAFDQKLKRDVAIKTLSYDTNESRRSSARNEWQRRFEHEAQSLAKLDHPNIIAVYDYGEHEGLAYLVMQCFAGQVLDTWWDAQKVTVKQGLGIARRILLGLDHAHVREVLHRDLKASNILVQGPADSPELKVIDWGLALSGDHSRLTDAGALVGTQGCIDPEIIADPTKDHDERSDLFAVGALLYWLWCEKDPVEVKDEWTATRRYDAFAKNEIVAPHLHNRVIAGDLESFIVRLLATKRTDRPRTAAEALDIVELLERGAEVDFAGVRKRHEKRTQVEGPQALKSERPASEGLANEIARLADDIGLANDASANAPPLPAAALVDRQPEVQAPAPRELIEFPSGLKGEAKPDAAPHNASARPDARLDMFNRSPPHRRRLGVGAVVATVLIAVVGAGVLRWNNSKQQPIVEALPTVVQANELETGHPSDKPALDRMTEPDRTQRLDAYDEAIVARYGTGQPIGTSPTTLSRVVNPKVMPSPAPSGAKSIESPQTDTSSAFRPANVQAGAANKASKVEIPNNLEAEAKLVDSLDTSSDETVRVALGTAVRNGDDAIIPAGALVIGRASLRNARAHIRFDHVVLADGTTLDITAIAVGSDKREGVVGRFEYGDNPGTEKNGVAGELIGEAALDVAGAVIPGADAASRTAKRAVGREVENSRHRSAEDTRRQDKITLRRGTSVRVVFNPTAYR